MTTSHHPVDPTGATRRTDQDADQGLSRVPTGSGAGARQDPRGGPNEPVPAPAKCAKCIELARLLLEARDALPAISVAAARLHGVSLTLADRIESALEPWRVEG